MNLAGEILTTIWWLAGLNMDHPASMESTYRFSFVVVLAFLVISSVASAADSPPPICNRVRFQPAKNDLSGMVGGKIEGSNISRTEGFVTLAEIQQAPPAKEWGELKFDNSKVYRYLRCTLPPGPGGFGTVEYYDGDRVIGALSEHKGTGINYFLNDQQDTRTFGIDLGDVAVTQRPYFNPPVNDLKAPAEVKITSTPGATIRYTLDGTWPGADHGEIYTTPIHVDKNTTIVATATLPDRAPSIPMTTTYLFPESTKAGFETVSLGNSLTGTTIGGWKFFRTAGIVQKSTMWGRGGALTSQLWNIATNNLADDKEAAAKEENGRKQGQQLWDDFWKKVGKPDILTLQPRDFELDRELAAEINFIKLFRTKSPDIQPYLYCEWVEMARQRPSDKGEVPSYQMTRTFPALTWEESMSAMLLYVEDLQHRLAAAHLEGKPAHIIPSALAMGWMKNLIDHGKFPGVKPGSFYSLLFADQVHPKAASGNGDCNGAFLVDMTWFATFYRESAEGKVLPIETTFTPEQAQFIEHLDWDIIKNYPDCGLYEDGTQPCGKPEFANDGKVITLKSSTPGAWFRYTLDGTTPTRTRGYVYCGAISVQPGIQPKAVAYKSGMADSEVAELHLPSTASK